jgi:hypothetical protein
VIYCSSYFGSYGFVWRCDDDYLFLSYCLRRLDIDFPKIKGLLYIFKFQLFYFDVKLKYKKMLRNITVHKNNFLDENCLSKSLYFYLKYLLKSSNTASLGSLYSLLIFYNYLYVRLNFTFSILLFVILILFTFYFRDCFF